MWDFIFTQTPLLYLVQSLWRDEAFSILVAEQPISSFIGGLNFEPPLYYVLFHIWLTIFGRSEIAARAFSLLGLSLATTVTVFWAEKIYKSKLLQYFLPVFFFLNPMLLYYGFEVRAYGWYMFFAVLSMYAYSSKRYSLLLLANVCIFYTHVYGILVPFVQCLHYLLFRKGHQLLRTPRKWWTQPFIRSGILSVILILPWSIPILNEAVKNRPTWYYPVDLQLVLSVVGNLFIGYDGTPGGMWGYTRLLSLILISLMTWVVYKQRHNDLWTYMYMTFLLPLLIVVGISFHKPLFVNRYLIFVTIAEVMLLTQAIASIKHRWLQRTSIAIAIAFVVSINLYLPSRKAKEDIRTVVHQAQAIAKNDDLLYVDSPLYLFETIYYATNPEKVYLYNPEGQPFPWYIGELAFDPRKMRHNLPHSPQRAIRIHNDLTISITYDSSTP